MGITGLVQVGRTGQVTIRDTDLEIVEGSYVCQPAERFGQKISIGALKYGDFNPWESSFSIDNLSGGYGLNRYSDAVGSSLEQIPPFYKEATNVDCREAGLVCLAPALSEEELPTSAAAPVWIGEFKGDLYAISGTTLFKRALGGSWSAVYTFDATVVAAGVFNNLFIVGYGDDHFAQKSADAAVWADLAVYVWAISADRAACYIAGGTGLADYNKVVSSADGTTFGGTPITCGSVDWRINSLAPGGTNFFLMVGKENELGAIDFDGNYTVQVPFDSRLDSNCKPMRWYAGAGGEESRGPMIVVFGRDRGIWSYHAGGDGGSANNISPWAMPSIRPANIKGAMTALQGTARYLYIIIQHSSGNSWLLARDVYTGATHSLIDLGAKDSDTMTVTSLLGSNPILYFGYGNNVAFITLPMDGDSPAYDSTCRFALQGTLLLSDIDYSFPDEAKAFYSLRVLADDLVGGQQTVDVEYNLDSTGWVSIGTIDESPSDTVEFPAATVGKRLEIRLTLNTNDWEKTPKIRGIVVRGRLNTQLKRIWAFQAILPQGETALGTENNMDTRTFLDQMWDDFASGETIHYHDRWDVEWSVQVKNFMEKHIVTEPDREPQSGVSIELIEVKKGGSGSIWDDAMFIWDSPASLWG